MLTPEQKRKIYIFSMSMPISVVTYGVIFALAMAAASNGRGPVWVYIAEGVVFGPFLALQMRRAVKKQVINLYALESWQMLECVKQKELPTDQKLKKEFPLFLDVYEETLRKSYKIFPVFAGIFILALLSLLVRWNTLFFIVCVGGLVQTARTYILNRSRLETIATLRKSL